MGGKPGIEETTPSVVGWKLVLELEATAPAAADWNLNAKLPLSLRYSEEGRSKLFDWTFDIGRKALLAT